MNVFIAQPLRSYTEQQPVVSAQGSTLDELLYDLDRQYPGIRFRMVNEQDEMRRHVVFVVDGERTLNLGVPLVGCQEVVILQALAGG
ncbi:MAG: MoaD/ThiS family protein [Pseudomonadales bacterium]